MTQPIRTQAQIDAATEPAAKAWASYLHSGLRDKLPHFANLRDGELTKTGSGDNDRASRVSYGHHFHDYGDLKYYSCEDFEGRGRAASYTIYDYDRQPICQRQARHAKKRGGLSFWQVAFVVVMFIAVGAGLLIWFDPLGIVWGDG